LERRINEEVERFVVRRFIICAPHQGLSRLFNKRGWDKKSIFTGGRLTPARSRNKGEDTIKEVVCGFVD
jgi:hypothetical protein